jgi:hypothetical protein
LSFTGQAQSVSSKVDQSIEKILREAEIKLSNEIVVGSRVFVMTPRFSAGVAPYIRDRIGAGLVQSLAQSKYVPVYQPFLEERTYKRIESSDTALRVIHSSSLFDDYKSMRSFVDTLNGYAVDLILVSRIHKNESDVLVLNMDLVDSRTLQIKSSSTVYSANKIKINRDTHMQISGGFGVSPSALLYRNYPQLSNGLVGPFETPINYQMIELGVYQDVLRGHEELKFGIVGAYESTFLQGVFNDSLYQINKFEIGALRLGLSLELSLLSNGPDPRPILSLTSNACISKPTLLDSYFSSDTRVTINFSRSLGGFIQIRFTDPIVKNAVYTDIINNQSYMLCYGASINI